MEGMRRTNNAAVPAPTPQIPRLVTQRFPAYKKYVSRELSQQIDKKFMEHKEWTSHKQLARTTSAVVQNVTYVEW
jgi:hypothetical protein